MKSIQNQEVGSTHLNRRDQTSAHHYCWYTTSYNELIASAVLSKHQNQSASLHTAFSMQLQIDPEVCCENKRQVIFFCF